MTVDHILNTLRRSATSSRWWQLCWTTSSHKYWAQQDCRQPDRWWPGESAGHWTEDHVKALSYKQSVLSSTREPAESIATPQEVDFDDEQIRALLAWPRYLLEREATERSQVYHSDRESLVSSSSQGLTSFGTREPVAVFSRQSRLNQDTFSKRDQCSLKHQQEHVSGSNEPIFRFCNPVDVAKSFPEGIRDHLLTQARSELLTQAHKVESLNNCIDELQQQAYAQRLELPSRIRWISKRGNTTTRRISF